MTLESQLHSAQSQNSARLEALYHLAVELSALRSEESVLNTALQHCLDLTESQFGFVGLSDPASGSLDVVAINGFRATDEFWANHHLIPMRFNIFARSVIENRPVRSDDAMIDPVRVGQPAGHPPVRTFLGVPLRIRNKPIGMIGVANRPEPYSDAEEQLLMTYAAQVAIVIRNVQLFAELTRVNEALEATVASRTRELEVAKEALAQKAAQLQQLLSETVDVQEQERQRIAQDMHDSATQLLVGAMLELKSAQKRLGTAELERAAASLAKVGRVLHQAEKEIKRVIHDLRPPSLDALGLAAALRRYIERYAEFSQIECMFSVLGQERRLPARLEIGCYRLVQEALQNVSTHAETEDARVILAFAPQMLKVTVLDEGCGFDLATESRPGQESLGLLGMRERAESMGGQLAIHSQPGQGTRVELLVPLGREVAA